MIIDAHTHTYPEKIAARAGENLGKFYNFRVAEDGTLSTLEKRCSECGIGGFLLLSVATQAAHVDHINETAAENMRLSREKGFEAYAFGGMHQDYPDFRSGVERIVSLGLYGVKIHPDLQGVDVDSPKLMPLYEELEKAGLRVFFHAGDCRPRYNYSAPEKIARICRDFPGLQVVGAHLGGYTEWPESEKSLMGKFDNIWYDLSQCHKVMAVEKVRYYIEKCGTDRVFFGSDYPAVTPAESLEAFGRMGFDDETYENIAYRNLRRFLGVTDD